MEKTEYSGWRKLRPHRPNIKPSTPPKDPSQIAYPVKDSVVPTKFFDRLSFIGDLFVGCFVVETTEGIIQIDCMWPDDRCVEMIEEGYRKLGLDINDLKMILVTHGHNDHFGKGAYFREKYGCKIYMSEVDYKLASTDGPHQHFQPMQYRPDGFISDGERIRLGDVEIIAVSTPGHSPGCLSYIIPVEDEGRKHKAALWGGTGIPKEPEMREKYLESVKRFSDICDKEQVDVEISTHPFVDCGLERMAICRDIVDGVANPFVIGKEAYKRYEQMFYDLCLDAIERDKA